MVFHFKTTRRYKTLNLSTCNGLLKHLTMDHLQLKILQRMTPCFFEPKTNSLTQPCVCSLPKKIWGLICHHCHLILSFQFTMISQTTCALVYGHFCLVVPQTAARRKASALSKLYVLAQRSKFIRFASSEQIQKFKRITSLLSTSS